MFLSIISALFAVVTMFAINYKLAFVVAVLTPFSLFPQIVNEEVHEKHQSYDGIQRGIKR